MCKQPIFLKELLDPLDLNADRQSSGEIHLEHSCGQSFSIIHTVHQDGADLPVEIYKRVEL